MVRWGVLWGAGCGVNHPTKVNHPSQSRVPAASQATGGAKSKTPRYPAETHVVIGFERGDFPPPPGAPGFHPGPLRGRRREALGGAVMSLASGRGTSVGLRTLLGFF